MKQNDTKTNRIRNLYLILLGFLSLSAIGGGGALIISPTGEVMGLPLSSFKNMPFDSYLIPGIILLSVLGVIPIILIIALLKKTESKFAEYFNMYRDMHWSWTFSIYIAFILIGWIIIQLIFLQSAIFWLHTFYVFYAVLMIIIALLPEVRDLYKKTP